MDVFVYGTLTDPDRVRSVLETDAASAADAVVGRATLEGCHRVDGRYPTLVPGGSVDGRVLAVDDAGLERLDRYEGIADGLYARVAVPIVGQDDDRQAAANRDRNDDRCWVYVGDPDRLGVDATWPGDGPFRERVQSVVSRADLVVRKPE
ncbi:gamma-glutamylcyclotransferase family protein [Natrinema versiforme]|uniref:AIG2 family protein n=1 Tax=Natrinema versiforme JCM 10478 TaxID=1227496 RepID=L9Y222_9EURY|nr:gamma-glutamylcyclotransferase family protein [Natrinema versiforme]ELY68065.1 AIG2 family protein [Natrinema versiforme JCM 10478]